MRKKEKPLTEQQKKAVSMLYECYPINEIAAALGVHRTTVWRWSNLRGFKREWKRLYYNEERRIMRREIKREEEERKYWEQRQREAKQKLDEENAKIKTKPGPAWYKANKEYEIALCRGHTLAELFSMIDKLKRKRSKRRKA